MHIIERIFFAGLVVIGVVAIFGLAGILLILAGRAIFHRRPTDHHRPWRD